MENLPLAVTLYEFSVWIHVTAVVVGFGMTFVEAILFPVAMNLNPRHLPYVHRLQMTINQKVAGPAMLLIVVTGIYQVADAGWSFGSFWISASFAIVIILGGMVGAYFIPADRRLKAMLDREIGEAGTGEFTPSTNYMRQARIEGMMGAAASVLIVVALYLMVIKPGA